MRSSRTHPGEARPGRALVMAAVALAGAVLLGVGAGQLPAAGSPARAAAQPAPADQLAPPSALVLVERLTTDGAVAAVGPGAEVAGFVSTLPEHQPLASRLLSLAAGRRVDALAALDDDPAAAGLPDPATTQRIRADNPGAVLGRLPPTRVLADPALEVAGLFTLGPSGPPRPPDPLPLGTRPIPVRPGRLLVLAVPDAPALAGVMQRLRPTRDAGPIMVLGLRAAPGRANAAPLLVLGQPDARGLVTSDSTHRLGLVALEDVRPTLTGGPSAGDDGTRIRIVDDDTPLAAVTRIDRRVAALVLARTWAIPLLCLAAVLALFALVAVWRSRRGRAPGRLGPPAGSEPTAGPAPLAKALLALTLALPSGYLVASMAEPAAARAWQAFMPGGLAAPRVGTSWAIAWVASGVAAAAALAAIALSLDRPPPTSAAPLQAPASTADTAPNLTPGRPSEPSPGSGSAPDSSDSRSAPTPPPDPGPGHSSSRPGRDPRWGSVAHSGKPFPAASTGDGGDRFPAVSTGDGGVRFPPASAADSGSSTRDRWTPPRPSTPSPGPPDPSTAVAPRLPAPVLLGVVLLGLVVVDLALGGHGLAQPLLGGSAWDGERFYGLGNGYFAFALAATMLVIGFGPLPAAWAAGLLVGLGVVDGLPRLGADVGGALTSMLTAAAALVVLAPGRPRVRRAVLLGGLAVAGAVVVALGVGLGGPVTHAGRFAERLQQGPGDAVGVVVDQLARNLRLLANSPFAWVGPLQVAAAALIALRPPAPLRGLSGWIRRVLGLGAFGSLLLILLNDTGVTATAASGLFLLAIPAWAWLERDRPPGPPRALAPARWAVGARPPQG